MTRTDYLDIIAIGAVNYDCIFFCNQVHRIGDTSDLAEVQEKFGYRRDDICRLIEDLKKEEGEYRISVGGSSFNSIRTAREIDKKIKLGFVAVCGKPGETEISLGFDPDPHGAFAFLDNQDWLFFDEEAPGLSCVQVLRSDGSRGDIAIVPGANDRLIELIREQEQRLEEDSFSKYLSRSKWIHVSSLADFAGFLEIVKYLKKAKELNPLLQISFDPGFQYTKEYKVQLREMIDLTDFLFLSQSEFDNLTEKSLHPGWKDKELIEELYKTSGESPRRVIVIKDKAHNVLYRYRNNRVKRLKFRHEQLSDSRILNDTGAGDAFAGGFICGNISERMQLHHPVPMELGARAAIARMEELGDPYRNIHSVTNSFLKEFENYEFFDDMMKKNGEMPEGFSETRDRRYKNLTGIYILCSDEMEESEAYSSLSQVLSATSLRIAFLDDELEGAEYEEILPLADQLEQRTHHHALIFLLDGDEPLKDPEFMFKLGYMTRMLGKEGILLLNARGGELPRSLRGFLCLDMTDPEWKTQLVSQLRQIGYSIA